MDQLKIGYTSRAVEYGMAVASYGSPQEREAVLPRVLDSFRGTASSVGFPADAEPEIVDAPARAGRRLIGWYYEMPVGA